MFIAHCPQPPCAIRRGGTQVEREFSSLISPRRIALTGFRVGCYKDVTPHGVERFHEPRAAMVKLILRKC